MQKQLKTTLKPPVRLSPSKISSHETCSWSYYSQYIQGLPNFDNDGSRRGSICHGVLEHFCRPKHRPKFDLVMKAQSVYADPACERYIRLFAWKVDLDLDAQVLNNAKSGWESNRDLISDMILVAMKDDFFGDENSDYTVEVIPEQVHEIKKDEDGIKYHVKGIVDKVFVKKNKVGDVVEVEIVDYKTSKQKFDKGKIASNIQAMVYQFFARKLFPDVKNLTFRFMFLRFPKSPWVETVAFSNTHLKGFELYLSHVSAYLSSYDESKGRSNMARFNGNKFICGKDGFKELYDRKTKTKTPTTEPHWKCPYKDPFDYWAVINKRGEAVRSYEAEEKVKISEGEVADGFSVQKMRYCGCPAWGHKIARKESLSWA